MSLHNGYTIYHPHWYCTKLEFLSLLVRSTVFVSEQKLSSQVSGDCAFDMHFLVLKPSTFYVLDALSQLFALPFWKSMCSSLLCILTFFVVFYWVLLDLMHFENSPSLDKIVHPILRHRACSSPSNCFSHREKLLIEPYLSIPVSSFTCAFVVTLIKM